MRYLNAVNKPVSEEERQLRDATAILKEEIKKYGKNF